MTSAPEPLGRPELHPDLQRRAIGRSHVCSRHGCGEVLLDELKGRYVRQREKKERNNGAQEERAGKQEKGGKKAMIKR